MKVENDSQSAVAAAEEFKPDLMFMDLTMPTVDGGELASRFRANPRLSSVPIVFLTGTVTKAEVAERGGYIGGLQFIAKPSNKDESLELPLRSRIGESRPNLAGVGGRARFGVPRRCRAS